MSSPTPARRHAVRVNGKAVRFDEAVRSMGRTATGVRGIRLAPSEQVVSLIIAEGEGDVLTATARGYGKRTALADYPKKGRGTQGVIAIQCSDRNGALVAALQIDTSHELMLISNQGTLVRTRASEVARVGRNTQGVTLIRLPPEEALVGVVGIQGLGGEDSPDEINGGANDRPHDPAACARPAESEGPWKFRPFCFVGSALCLADCREHQSRVGHLNSPGRDSAA
jgi:DNA gyrase subunit A